MSPLGRNLPFPQGPPNLCGPKQELLLKYHNNALWNVTMGNTPTSGILQGVPPEAQEEVITGDIIIQLAAPGGITFDILNVCMDVRNGELYCSFYGYSVTPCDFMNKNKKQCESEVASYCIMTPFLRYC